MKILVNDFSGHAFQLQLSRHLAGLGHSVLHTYFAGNNTPKGATGAEPGCDLQIRALDIGRAFKKHSLLARRRADIDYGEAVAAQVRAFRPDVVLSSNMPLDAQKILMRASREIGAGFVFWLQDVLSMAAEFVLRRKRLPFAALAGKLYSRLERRLLIQSDAVVCIAPQFEVLLDSWRVPQSKTFVIENWAPLEEIELMPKNNPWAREQGVAGKFCFLYSGTLGMKHRPELLLELARRYQHRDDVTVVVVAQGVGADWLKANADVKPGSLVLLPFQPYERLSEVLASSDALVALLDSNCGGFAVPSKTLAYLCASRALLLAAPESNLAAQIVAQAGAGEVVPSGDSSSFLEAADRLLNDDVQRRQYALNARQYAERTFDIKRIAEEFLEIFASLPQSRDCVPVPSRDIVMEES